MEIKPENLKENPKRAYRPVPTTVSTIKNFGAIALVYLALGIYLLHSGKNLVEESFRYDDICYPKSGNWFDLNERDVFPRGGPF